MLCYSKQNVLLLDDDLQLLDTIKYYLNKNLFDQIHFESFNNSKSFFKHLEDKVSSCINISDVYLSVIENQCDIYSALDEIENFAPILIADHNLGESKKGSDLCEHVKQYYSNISIFLLTGELDYESANELHNKKIIDFFIKKDKSNLISCIVENINSVINNRKKLFNFDGELKINSGIDILYKHLYIKKLKEMLQNIQYRSYMVMNESGSVVIRNYEGNVFLYNYNNSDGQFIKNESSNFKAC
jgi:FixJ family two-component response regulator